MNVTKAEVSVREHRPVEQHVPFLAQCLPVCLTVYHSPRPCMPEELSCAVSLGHTGG